MVGYDEFMAVASKRYSQDVTSPGGLVRVVRVPVCKVLPSVVGNKLNWAILPDDLVGFEAAIRDGYTTEFTVRVPDRLNHAVMAVMRKI